MAETASNRIVINVLGKNRAGIVAAVSRILGEANVDIRDITQSIIEDIFTMTMIADASQSSLDFSQLQESLTACGSEVGVEITLQREDVFNFMYRL
ncbi:MAG: ACT domain-containing protein [Coriobacteriaceae bacterium]|nr:ACT domain-containing protein [Coriobacteriaceae bacterium]